jgi:uncharacterized protein (AIM24 family)
MYSRCLLVRLAKLLIHNDCCLLLRILRRRRLQLLLLLLLVRQRQQQSIVMLKSGAWLSGGLFNLKISGTGSLAITTHFDPLVLMVSPDNPLMTDPETTVAWSASLEPKLKATVNFKTVIGKGSGETFQLSFANATGFVIVQPYEETPFNQKEG